jgi:hypothetical protein
MANTLASQIAGGNFIIEGTPIYKYGQLAGTYKPGTFVYMSAAGVWTVIDADTAGTIIMNYGVVGYKERILSTGAISTIDDAYATTDTGVPILVGFEGGKGEFVAWIDDPAATIFEEGTFVVSETEGCIETGAGVTAKLAAGDPKAPITNIHTLVTGDRYMHARWAAA